MNKFIVLRSWERGTECLVNVANVCWVRKYDDTRIEIKFSNGPSEIFYNNGLELTEMMVGRPWYINILNAVRWLFHKKRRVNK